MTLLFLTSLSGCGIDCDNEVISTVASPSGKLAAVVFNRGCGATTGFNTQVSILHAGATLDPNDGGNVLILDGTVPLKIEWQSDSAVSISKLNRARVFKQENFVAGVSITYGN